jgi:hypothetical protein
MAGVHLREVKKILIHQANGKIDEAILDAPNGQRSCSVGPALRRPGAPCDDIVGAPAGQRHAVDRLGSGDGHGYVENRHPDRAAPEPLPERAHEPPQARVHVEQHSPVGGGMNGIFAPFNLENLQHFIDWSRSEPYKGVRGEGECAV